MSYWYKDGSDGIVVSSRVRLARNITDIPFPRRMTYKMLSDLNERVKVAVTEISKDLGLNLRFIEMDNVPEAEIKAMVERHIISREFGAHHKGRSIAISEDESISIMVGEEDHIRLQVIGAGLSLDSVFETADKIDTALGEKLSFAYDSEFGYLTECPTNIGTGLRASVMLHLPLCDETKSVHGISEAVGKIGFTVRGLYGEGSESKAGLYQISNQITLGISEQSAIENLKLITAQIVEKEEGLRRDVDKVYMEDAVSRALGTLKFARLLDSTELMQLVSRIKLGKDMGIIDIGDANPIELMIIGGAGMLESKYGVTEPLERDEFRAKMIRKMLK